MATATETPIKLITQAELKELMYYDPESGIFTWLKSTANRIKVGSVVGSLDRNGYLRVTIHGRYYPLHKLAILYMTGTYPEKRVDHKNTKRTNNVWDNLRIVDNAQNCHNRSMHSNNSSGIKGVSWHKRYNKWAAEIMCYGKRTYLGYFTNIEDAKKAVDEARAIQHKEFANYGY